MAIYKLLRNSEVVLRVDTNESFPPVVGNKQYDEYLLWLADGNAVLPADGPSAEELATTTAMTARQATLTRITDNFPTSWTNFDGMVTDAIAAKIKPNNTWTANDSRDGVKLLLNIALFCAAKLLVLIIERQDRR